MREINFLPGWYPRIQQSHRLLIVQGWITLAILAALSGYAGLKRWQVHGARLITTQCQAQITLSRRQLIQLSEKLKYEAELRRQAQIVARLGLGVDSTRLLKSLEEAMTPEMALTNVSLDTVELQRPNAAMNVRASAGAARESMSDVDRRLKVTVDGVAPSDIQVAAMVENLSKVDCFEGVAFGYMREGRTRDGHITREFEVTFEMNLNPPADNAIAEGSQ